MGSAQLQGRMLAFLRSCPLAISLTVCLVSTAQVATLGSAQAKQPERPQDPLGRTTPRGTVVGFMNACNDSTYETASRYLDTRLEPTNAAALARKLCVVLDRRFPAKLISINNEPEGSLADQFDERRELIGTVASERGNVKIVLERLERGKDSSIWLFSHQTLAEIPDVYDEMNPIPLENVLPEFLIKRYFGVSLFGWLFAFAVIPVFYATVSLVGWLLNPLLALIFRRLGHEYKRHNLLPHAIRLLLLSLAIRWVFSKLSVSLVGRQMASITASFIAIFGFVWLFILLNGKGEFYLKKYLVERGRPGMLAILRPTRRAMDVVAIIIGFLVTLYTFGINPTAALAGLGVGGIAVALAAQKTLENVIGGASLIMDEALRIGDFLKIGDVIGTVEEIGLRSTRLRTLDRTLVSIPNGQIATMTLENLSARDSFWLHHVLRLRYETATSELNSAGESVRNVLANDARVRPSSVRVRFLRFGDSSLELELFAYVMARDWSHFLEIQEALLVQIKDFFVNKGIRIAFPSQTLYLTNDSDKTVSVSPSAGETASASA